MNAKGYNGIPSELCYWITFLCKALPLRSVGTFIELLIGAMLTPTGFVTDAYLMVNMRNHWTSYYKWLQRGKWSWLALARQFLRLVLANVKQDVLYLAIDDTLTLRASKKAPCSQIHHQHGNKANLATYVLGQCWVNLAMIVRRPNNESVALPILSRLMPSSGNTGKLVAAMTLIRATCRLFQGMKVRVLTDSGTCGVVLLFRCKNGGLMSLVKCARTLVCMMCRHPERRGSAEEAGSMVKN